MYPAGDDRRGSGKLDSTDSAQAPQIGRSEATAGDAAPAPSASAPFDPIDNETMPGPVPDLRRDALEEAAETSPEARERIRELDRRVTGSG